MINGFVQCGDFRRARALFDEMPQRNVTSSNGMIMAYCWTGLLQEARELFDRMREWDSVSWK
ncbi:hypothetical protein SAY86_001578 [Trapa natans]|uniref:Pentatricopeptide repeat-containing protein n=1 Tax=Trapa natans TaxID=22666 RepID=A0AAN7RHP8_TRANT|nr:hypothetical protein SAY86_001578 [Trapa natans]